LPVLSEFLGTIMQETVRARMLSDLESIRIAEAYYQDIYLKHLPIPHFKMPEIIIEMPVEIKQINPPGNDVTNATMMSKMRERVYDDLALFLTTALEALKQDSTRAGRITLRTTPTSVVPASRDQAGLGDAKQAGLEDAKQAGLGDAKQAGLEDATPVKPPGREVYTPIDGDEFGKQEPTQAVGEDDLGARIRKSCQEITETVFRDGDYIDVNTTPIRLTALSDDLNDLLYQKLITDYKEFFPTANNQTGATSGLDLVSIRNILDNVRQLFMGSVTFILKDNETTLAIEGSTDRLAQAGGLGFLTKLKMTVREQDYEWTIMDREDGVGLERRSLTVE